MAKIAVVAISSILLVAAVVGTVTYGMSKKNGDDAGTPSVSSSSKGVHSVCQYTDYKDTCEKSLAKAKDSDDPQELAKVAFEAAIEAVKEVMANSSLLKEAATDPKTSQAFEICKEVLDDSIDDLERSIEKIQNFDKTSFDEFVDDLTTWLSGAGTFQETCIDAFENTTGDTAEKMKALMKTTTELTSNGLAIVTQLGKVLEGLQIPGFSRRLLSDDDINYKNYNPAAARSLLSDDDINYKNYNPAAARSLLSDDDINYKNYNPAAARSLLSDDDINYKNYNPAAVRSLLSDDDINYKNYNPAAARSLLSDDDINYKNDNPAAVRSLLSDDDINYKNYNPAAARSLLSDDDINYHPEARSLLAADPKTLKPNAVVALDGSGQFKSIQAAINKAPLKVNQTFIIKVKAGIYREYVEVPKKAYNIYLIGEGPTKTRITGNKNFADGTGTFKTATVAVNGDNFIARDIGFENSAGAIKHQAVALRVSADRCIFHNCHMDGYQDTLYAHNHRQYYRDCTISGTIDFIFGDAAAVFQNCKMVVRKPMDNQACMVTAQGRKDPRGKGATVLQNCTVTAEPAFLATNPRPDAFLGRPWKEYSRTIVMQSFIDNIIVPQGWAEWAGTYGLDTLSYAEYQNRGPGANTAKRVQWKGMKKLSPDQAMSFTPGTYIDGKDWIQATGLPYTPGMMKV